MVHKLYNIYSSIKFNITLLVSHCSQDAEAKDLYVKRSDGTSTYEGWCWPGSSSWIDFVSPDIRQWWAEQFALDKYQVREQ